MLDEGKRFSTGPPPPPHPAELAPRSIHRSKPSRYHTTAAAGTRTGGTDEDGGKRKLMNYKQVTAQDVKKRALDKKDASGGGGKKVYFEVKRSKEEEEEEAEGDEEEIEVIEGWSWVDDDEEAIQTKNDKSLSWSQKMEVRMRKTRPLFANSN
jgi:hypothetical protein